jgi:hypothetical protein
MSAPTENHPTGRRDTLFQAPIGFGLMMVPLAFIAGLAVGALYF